MYSCLSEYSLTMICSRNITLFFASIKNGFNLFIDHPCYLSLNDKYDHFTGYMYYIYGI
jgi:hypothetical protein